MGWVGSVVWWVRLGWIEEIGSTDNSVLFRSFRSNSDIAIRFSDADFLQQDAQLSQRDRAAGCVIVFAKSRRLEQGDNILRTL